WVACPHPRALRSALEPCTRSWASPHAAAHSKNRCMQRLRPYFFWKLTLELSGGEAVRLERNVRRVRRDAFERWLVAKLSAEHEQPATPKLPALKAEDLTQRAGKMLPHRSTASCHEAGRNTRHEEPTRATA